MTRKGETAFTVKAVREGNKLTLSEDFDRTVEEDNVYQIMMGGYKEEYHIIVKDTENGIIIVPEGCRQEIEL